MQQNSWSFQGLFFRWLKLHTDYPLPMFVATVLFLLLLILGSVAALVPYALMLMIMLHAKKTNEYLHLYCSHEGDEAAMYHRLWSHRMNLMMGAGVVIIWQIIVIMVTLKAENTGMDFPFLAFYVPVLGLFLYYLVFIRTQTLGASAYGSFKDWVERKDAETNGKDAD